MILKVESNNLMEAHMNSHLLRPFLVAFCGALLCIGSNAIFANENEEEASFPEVVRIEQKENENDQVNEPMPLSEVIGNYNNDGYYLQRIHNDGYYHLVAYSDTGDVVQLHDASKWQIARSGRQQVLYWVQSDDIFIKPCISWFSSNRYVLHNRTTNQAVEAQLINPPLPMGAYTFRIVNIQPYERLVLLSDNTVWQVGPDSNFSQWKIGQRLLVGVNNKWRTATYPHILINVDMPYEPYSQAIFYGYPAGY
jgi:hypothetical protein